MCSTVNLKTRITQNFFLDLQSEPIELDYNIPAALAFGHPDYPILCAAEGKLQIAKMEWGVVPLFVKDEKERSTRRLNMINARSERILEDKKSYWYRLRNNRCLIPVTGIYEHRKIDTWKKKVPYLVSEVGRDLFFIPGLFQDTEYMTEDGPERSRSFTMITRVANEVMANIHNDGANKHRMPLFLTPELEQAWIDPTTTESGMKDIFSFEQPAELLNWKTVYTLRGDRPDGKEVDAEFAWNNLPPLGTDTPQSTLF